MDENVQRECKAIERLNAISSKKEKYMLDVTTEWGQHAEQRLRSNSIAWLTPESMAADYSLGIRVTPTKFKSWA